MRGFFRMEGSVFEFLNRLADLFILNILFLITCIPIVTIGPALSGLSYSTMKMVDKQEGYVWKNYLKSFKENLKQGIVLWLIMLFFAVVLYLDFAVLRVQEGSIRQVMFLVVLIGAMIWLMVLSYLFPLQAKFVNTITGTLRNALLLAIANAPRTFLLMAITVGAVVLTFWNTSTFVWGLLVWLMVGFSLLSFLNSKILFPVFQKLIPPEEEDDEAEEEEPEAAEEIE